MRVHCSWAIAHSCDQTKPASGAGAAGTNWKSFAEGLGGAGAKIPGYSLGLLKNAITSVGGVILPGWSMRRIGWVAGAGMSHSHSMCGCVLCVVCWLCVCCVLC